MTSIVTQQRRQRCDPKDPLYSFGDMLKAYRLARCVSVNDFAHVHGVTDFTVRNWERGPHNLFTVAKVLSKLHHSQFLDLRISILERVKGCT